MFASRLCPRWPSVSAALIAGLLLSGCGPVGNNLPQANSNGNSATADKDKDKDKDAKGGKDPGKANKDTKGGKEADPRGSATALTPPPEPMAGPLPSSTPAPPPVESPPPPPPVVPAGPAGPMRRVALLVGIAKYDSEVGDLLYPENDVNALAAVLKSGGYKPEDVVVMTTTAGGRDPALLPTAANITKRLNTLLATLKKDDLVMVAFAGHGVQPAADKAYFCAYQTKLSDPATMVTVEDVITAMNKSAATTKIMLVDACRDTVGAKAPKVMRDTAVVDLPTVTGRDGTATIAFFSCDKGEKSWEVDDLKHGVFFAHLIDGLGGAADSHQDGQISWSQMVDYVQRNINFHNSKYEAKKQTPHFRGEVRNAAPIVVRPRTDGGSAPVLGSGDAVNEDFRTIKSGGLPRGWDGPAFSCTYDEKVSRACVELRRKEGGHALNVPLAKPLAGNFAVEIEFCLAGLTNTNYQSQALALWLVCEGGQVIPIVIDHEGKVSFANVQPRKTEKYRPNEVNRLKLVRTGNSYALFLNDGDAASTQISYTGQVNGLQLRVGHGWEGEPGKGPNLLTRFYSVKAGSVTVGDPAKVGRTVLYENFHSRDRGAVLPTGWLGEAFSVATDERWDLRALEVNKADSGIYWVVVPKQEETIGRGKPFVLELETRLCAYHDTMEYYSDRAQAQEVYLRFEGPGAVPLTVVMDAYGHVRLTGEKEVKAIWFAHHGSNRLRLVHQNGVFQVIVNGVSVVESKRGAGNYAGFGIGLVGGVPKVNDPFAAKLFSVRLTALPGPEAPVTTLKGIAQDFLTTPISGGPPDWVGTNMACRMGYGRIGNRVGAPGLELTDADKAGRVAIPGLKLDGDFTAGFEFFHHDQYYLDTIGVGLYGPAKTPPIEVALFYKDSKFWLQAKNGTTAYPAANVTAILVDRKPNSISIERAGNAMVVQLNGQKVGIVPVGKTPVTYEGAQVHFETTSKYSPRLTSVLIAAK